MCVVPESQIGAEVSQQLAGGRHQPPPRTGRHDDGDATMSTASSKLETTTPTSLKAVSHDD